jgi:hypothetical protein
MSFMRNGKYLNRSKVLICLLAYFIGWMESANALPLLFVALDDSHKAIVTENQGKLHLTVHHRGNGDRHEHSLRGKTIITSGTSEQSDHEIGVSGGEQLVSPATKIVKLVNEFTVLTSVQIAPVDTTSQYYFANTLPQAKPYSAVRSTVLLL